MELHRIPLTRLLVPFLIGILISHFIPISYSVILIGFGFSFLFLLSFLFLTNKKQSTLSLSGWVGIIVYTAVFFAGCFASYQSNALNNAKHLTRQKTYQKLLVRVLTPPQKKTKTYKVIANAVHIYSNTTQQNVTGKIVLYISKKGFDSTLTYGDYLIINNKLKPPPTAIGADSFNYAKWLSYQNIYHQVFLKAGEYIKTDKHSSNPLFQFSYTARNHFDKVLYKHLPDSSTYSVASAIILGIRNHITDDLNNAYARTGTIHILAVSGLHVGIIYIVLLLLLGGASKRKWASFIKALLLLGGLWLYALLTGLSPSVVRASTMFSFIAMGNAMGRKTNLFNTLAAAALFTLAINANTVFQVGFQLSYLAVAGIGLFYAPLMQLLTPKTWLFTKIWQLLCVSFAAQVATFPLAIYYFHQFPNYFLFSNLFIVPLGILSVYLGLLLLLVSPLPFIAVWVGKALHLVVSANNYIAQTIESLPFAYASKLYISMGGGIAIYGSILSLFLYLKTKKAVYLICLLVLLIALTIM